MKNYFLTALACCLILFVGCTGKQREGNAKVLVFSKTMGFKHASIPKGIEALQKLGSENNFQVDTTKNAALFTDENLQQYSAIVFLSTTGNVLDAKQEAAFERYIQAGGGFVGIHAATDTEYDWGWYTKLVGAQFLSHPSGTPEADFIITDRNFPATEFFTDTVWHRTDELYNYKNMNPDVNVIMTLDESTYEGGQNGDHHPIAWYHEYDGGRAFYTGGGHTDESYTEDLFLKHVLGGIQYAIGKNEILDYGKATSQIPPDTNRFSKVPLVGGDFFEPTEMTILPNNDILIGQRRGEILHYSATTNEMKQVALLDVYFKTLQTPGVNAEEGLMGLQKDPDFAVNNWVYVYYAPTGEAWTNRLSRFKFIDGVFDTATEQVILTVDSQREICCHTGGSIAFGPDNLLYLSTGDNSTPFNEKDQKYVNNGFAPLNDAPGHEQFDARRSSANTNDLRGKILRIKVNEDGSYDIPEGNLFPVGTDKTRPEIYTMGHRNPYRISVDPKNGYLFWGDVGPDARADSLGTRGPKGYDEMNLAIKAGNFGWPMFIGNNSAYHNYNYETGVSGEAFDPAKPINDSRNNTGLRELPPAVPAYVYYPYDETPSFPQVGTGSRNAMAGPTYYSDLFPNGGSLPAHYNGKTIIYEWMRGWMFAVSLFKDGTFNKMEPFASDIKLSNLIDMELGPDGRLYLLEYGSGWFSKNDDSGLSYIEFNGGNRPPVIDNLIVDTDTGKLPLTVTAKVTAEDLEGDSVSYLWDFGNGDTKETTVPEVAYTYENGGDYKLSVEVKDTKGASANSSSVSIVAGNSRPQVTIDLQGGNSSFFIAGQPISYKVNVTDADGTEDIDLDNVFVSVDYMEGMDQANNSLGHQQVSAAVTGKALTEGMDCKSCHKEAEKSIGPSYLQIAEKYKNDRRATAYLQKKIVSGGSGVWGEVAMAAHPNITDDETRQIALYIRSLADSGAKQKSLPLEGRIVPNPTPTDNALIITASYTDKGINGIRPLTGVTSIALQGSTVKFSGKTKVEGFSPVSFGGMDLLILPSGEGWFALKDIDLKGVSSVVLTAMWQQTPTAGADFEMHLDAPDGPLLGKGSMPKPAPGQPAGTVTIKLDKPVADKAQEIYFVYKPKADAEAPGMMAFVNAKFNGK
ncbi:ThuA domain-containing protein [Arenibacter sp. GZD96]|uniref:ThuA domain-containing protein n=1 Tax=Aurantibrevibacter litoralis TaxID=3106030 RepID=UPI002AFDE6B3|nr:ThuA domain-containing protein [Arenibacter sp. GZD-96]MEA1785991.1 ThuA domain-containing protein [Arenibacter sp. GZD-96]